MTASTPPHERVIREWRTHIMGCPQCGAEARWRDSVEGDDYWWLPCGHRCEKVYLTKHVRVLA